MSSDDLTNFNIDDRYDTESSARAKALTPVDAASWVTSFVKTDASVDLE
jgi:hypothetical protein